MTSNLKPHNLHNDYNGADGSQHVGNGEEDAADGGIRGNQVSQTGERNDDGRHGRKPQVAELLRGQAGGMVLLRGITISTEENSGRPNTVRPYLPVPQHKTGCEGRIDHRQHAKDGQSLGIERKVDQGLWENPV